MPAFRVVTAYNFEFCGGEPVDSSSMTESDGYRPIDEMIQELMLAGERLEAVRSGYDYMDHVEDAEAVPYGADVVDIENINRIVDKRVMDALAKDKAAKEAAEAAKAEPNGAT